MSIRIGFIGTGGIAASHLATLAPMPEVEVVALCDISSENIEATKQNAKQRLIANDSDTMDSIDRLLTAVPYTDYRPMLRNERLNAVYVCLPPFVHGDPEEAVIEAGLPMLVEKPVALELRVAARILDSIRDKNLLVATGYQLRHAAYVQRAKELLVGQTIGMSVVTRFGKTPKATWYHRQDRSGGQMVETATHQVDMLRYLVGEVETVYAAAATRINHRLQPDYDIFDVNCMTMKFQNGAVANFATNLISDHGSPLQGSNVHIFCGGLTLSLSQGHGLLAVSAAGKEERSVGENPMALENTTFVRAVSEGRPDLIKSDYENGVRNLAVTLANDLSARTGQPISFAQLLADQAPSCPLVPA